MPTHGYIGTFIVLSPEHRQLQHFGMSIPNNWAPSILIWPPWAYFVAHYRMPWQSDRGNPHLSAPQ
jgi:hypothetical protein